MLKNLKFIVLAISIVMAFVFAFLPETSVEIATPASATATAPDPLEPLYLERKAIYDVWKSDLDQMVASSNVGPFKEVRDFLTQGVTIIVPDGDDQGRALHPRDSDVAKVLVLLPSDRDRGQVWKDMYDRANVAAQFLAEKNMLVLRAEKLSPKTRGMILGHEGAHAFIFSRERKLEQTDEEYCDEEAMVHRLEYEVFGSEPAFVNAVTSESAKVLRGMQAKKGVLDAKIELPLSLLEAVFGPVQSNLDQGYQATLFSHAVIIDSFLKYHGDDEVAMDRFSSYLCGVYKKHDIR